MWGLIAEIGILGLDYAYHRWFEDKPPPPPPAQYISIPRVDAGAPYPLIYGRCRVRAPVIAWAGNALKSGDGVTTPYTYRLDQFIALGIPFRDGTGRLLGMWAGDVKWGYVDQGAFMTGDGNFELPAIASSNRQVSAGVFSGGFVEFLNGKSTQQLVDGAFAATTLAAQRMIAAGLGGTGIPGYRHFACAMLTGGPTDPWVMDAGTQVPSYSFETSSYPSTLRGPADRVEAGDSLNADANPCDVIWDILTAPVGKLGIDPSRISAASFQHAAYTLAGEGHGFSRSFEGGQTAAAMIQEILEQIDATLYEDPGDGQIKIKLIRADYDPYTLPIVGPNSCKAIEGFQMGGWTGIPNKIRINFSNRQDSYRDASATAQNQANAAGQDGQVRETALSMPGVCTQVLANTIATRELGARSAPLIKCSAIVSRAFYLACPGDCVRLYWPEYNIPYTVMRVARVSRGTLENGAIRLDLIQDFHYVWRNRPPVSVGVRSFGNNNVGAAQ